MTPPAPPPRELASTLRNVADILDRHGDRALELAPLLAARGWPASTMGNGSRGDSGYTSVESAVVAPGKLDTPDITPNLNWNDVDVHVNQTAHQVWVLGLALRTMVIRIIDHAPTVEQNRKTGGDCFACDRVVAGTHVDRLRAGYCNACRMAWERAGRPDRVQFQRQRRQQVLEEQNRRKAL